MTKRVIYRNTMLATGILAAVVILMSRAFHQEASSFLSKIKTEQTEKTSGDQDALIAAPSDAVTSAPAAEKADTDPSFIREILLDDASDREPPTVDTTFLASFLKTLFRTVIAPQAP